MKIILKLSFANLACFTRKWDLGQMTVFEHDFETYALHGDFDANMCLISHI